MNDFNAGSSIGAWTVVGVNVSLISTNYSEVGNGINSFNSQQGIQSVDLTGSSNTGLSSGVQQDVATSIGQSYSLSFFVGRASSSSGFYQLASTADLSINNGTRVSFTNSNFTTGSINWQQFSTNFTATTATTRITFFNGTAGPGNNFVGLDNVVLAQNGATAAPDASSLALLACGGLSGFAMFRRKLAAR